MVFSEVSSRLQSCMHKHGENGNYVINFIFVKYSSSYVYLVCVFVCYQSLFHAGEGQNILMTCCLLLILCSGNNASKSGFTIVIKATERQVTAVSSDQLFEVYFP